MTLLAEALSSRLLHEALVPALTPWLKPRLRPRHHLRLQKEWRPRLQLPALATMAALPPVEMVVFATLALPRVAISTPVVAPLALLLLAREGTRAVTVGLFPALLGHIPPTLMSLAAPLRQAPLLLRSGPGRRRCFHWVLSPVGLRQRHYQHHRKILQHMRRTQLRRTRE